MTWYSIIWLSFYFFLVGFGVNNNPSSQNSKELKCDGDKVNLLPSFSISVLQEIGKRCRSKVNYVVSPSNILDYPSLFRNHLICIVVQVEFRPVVSTSDDLQFSVEVSTMYTVLFVVVICISFPNALVNHRNMFSGALIRV